VLLGLRAVDRTLCVVPLSRAHGSETLALPTLLARDAVLQVAEVQIWPRGAARDLHEPSRRRADERRLHVDRWAANRPVGNGCV